MVSGEITALDKTGLDSGVKYKDKENTHGNYSKKQKLQYRSRMHWFSSIKNKVAELTAPDIFLHYRRLLDGRSLLHEADRKKFYEEYDKKTEELDRKHNGEMSDILDFLYESDCSGEMDVKQLPFHL